MCSISGVVKGSRIRRLTKIDLWTKNFFFFESTDNIDSVTPLFIIMASDRMSAGQRLVVVFSRSIFLICHLLTTRKMPPKLCIILKTWHFVQVKRRIRNIKRQRESNSWTNSSLPVSAADHSARCHNKPCNIIHLLPCLGPGKICTLYNTYMHPVRWFIAVTQLKCNVMYQTGQIF